MKSKTNMKTWTENSNNTRQAIDARQMVESSTCLFRYSILGKTSSEHIREYECKKRPGALAKWDIIDDDNNNNKNRWPCACRRVYYHYSSLRWGTLSLLSINRQNWEINVFYYVFVICAVVLILLRLRRCRSISLKVCWFHRLIYLIVTKSIIFQCVPIKFLP